MARSHENHELFFLSNTLGAFYQSMLKFFTESFYPRFKHGVITTSDNTIQELKQYHENRGQETYAVPVPSCSIDPSGDFEPDERTNFHWRYSSLTVGQGALMYDPIYADDYVRITPVYNRFVGTFPVYMFLSSWYELVDMKLKVIDWFANKNRHFRPQFVRTYLHIPEELITFRYQNDVLNIDQQLDWSRTLLKYHLYKQIGQNAFMHPITLNPLIKLTGVSTNVTKFGDQTSLPDHRLELSFEWEMDIPTNLFLELDYRFDNSRCNLYVVGEFFPQGAVHKIERNRCCFNKKHYNKYDYMVYVAEQSGNPLDIEIPYELDSDMRLEIFLSSKRLQEHDDWDLTGKILSLNNVIKDDIYHIIVWKEVA